MELHSLERWSTIPFGISWSAVYMTLYCSLNPIKTKTPWNSSSMTSSGFSPLFPGRPPRCLFSLLSSLDIASLRASSDHHRNFLLASIHMPIIKPCKNTMHVFAATSPSLTFFWFPHEIQNLMFAYKCPLYLLAMVKIQFAFQALWASSVPRLALASLKMHGEQDATLFWHPDGGMNISWLSKQKSQHQTEDLYTLF